MTLFVTGLITTTVDPYVLFRAFSRAVVHENQPRRARSSRSRLPWRRVARRRVRELEDEFFDAVAKKALVEIDEQAEANVGKFHVG